MYEGHLMLWYGGRFNSVRGMVDLYVGLKLAYGE